MLKRNPNYWKETISAIKWSASNEFNNEGFGEPAAGRFRGRFLNSKLFECYK